MSDNEENNQFGFSSLGPIVDVNAIACDLVALREKLNKLAGFGVSETKYSDLIPQFAVVKLLEAEFDQDGFSFVYAKHSKELKAPDSTTKDKFLTRINKRKKIKGFARKLDWDIKEKDETCLSINAYKDTLVIVKLRKNSNLQFNRSGSAISTDWRYVVQKQSSEGSLPDFGEMGKVCKIGSDIIVLPTTDVKSNGINAAGTPHPKTIDGCKTAYFVIRGRPSGTSLPFNIHLDIVGENDEGVQYYIPIIIDPDVRHPGGSPSDN